MATKIDPSYKTPVKGTAKIGDLIPGTDSCTVVVFDETGRETAALRLEADDLIPAMARLGHQLGSYLGNNTYNLV